MIVWWAFGTNGVVLISEETFSQRFYCSDINANFNFNFFNKAHVALNIMENCTEIEYHKAKDCFKVFFLSSSFIE